MSFWVKKGQFWSKKAISGQKGSFRVKQGQFGSKRVISGQKGHFGSRKLILGQNAILHDFFCTGKKCWLKKNLAGKKFSVTKNFGGKKILAEKNFGGKKFRPYKKFVGNNFWRKIFLVENKILPAKKIWWEKVRLGYIGWLRLG